MKDFEMSLIYLKPRSIITCLLLSIITCGFYALYWMICINNEFRRATGQNEDGLMMLLLSVITCGLGFLYWIYRLGLDIQRASEGTRVRIDSSEAIIYLLLTLFGLSIVALAIMQNRENMLCDEV